jgi:two-component system OmpR family sensor kinase
MRSTLRVRLTFWYVGLLAAVLIVFSAGFYSILDNSYRQRLDAGLRSAAQVTALALNHETEEHRGKAGGEENVKLVMNTMHQTSFPRPAIAVWDGSRLVAEKPGSAGLSAVALRQLAGDFKVGGNTTGFLSVSADHDSERYRVAVAHVWVGSSQQQYTVVANESTRMVETELRTVVEILMGLVPFFLIAAAAGGYLLARKSLVPVTQMAHAADQISSDNLTQRLPVGNPNDELGMLAQTFNRMFERLHGAFEQQRQFMADASHELRTPMSVALTAAQVSLDNRTATPDALYDTLEVVQSQMLRLRRVVEDMFTLAQADSGAYKANPAPMYLDEVVQESVRAGKVLGKARDVKVGVVGNLTECEYTGDEGLLRQVLLILIDNAVKYTPPGGQVNVSLDRAYGSYRIRVADTGCGIAVQDQARIFDRFFRADKSRSRKEPGAGSGAGLGLAIAQWIAGIHHGRLWLERSDASGSVFCMELPGPLAQESAERLVPANIAG